MIAIVKKIFVASMVLCISFLNANGQQLKFGVKGGLNLANLGEDATGLEYRIGVHAGGFASIPVVAGFKLQPEIIYSQQGAQSDFGDDELKFDYLNIPIMVKFMFTNHFNLQAGPQIGILVSAQQEVNGQEIDVKDTLKSSDFGVGFGVGYETADNVMIDVRYNLGLSDVADDGNDNISTPNKVIQVSLGIAF